MLEHKQFLHTTLGKQHLPKVGWCSKSTSRSTDSPELT